MRSGRVYAHRGLCSNNCWSEGRNPRAEKSPIMQMTSNKLLHFQIPVLLGWTIVQHGQKRARLIKLTLKWQKDNPVAQEAEFNLYRNGANRYDHLPLWIIFS